MLSSLAQPASAYGGGAGKESKVSQIINPFDALSLAPEGPEGSTSGHAAATNLLAAQDLKTSVLIREKQLRELEAQLHRERELVAEERKAFHTSGLAAAERKEGEAKVTDAHVSRALGGAPRGARVPRHLQEQAIFGDAQLVTIASLISTYVPGAGAMEDPSYLPPVKPTPGGLLRIQNQRRSAEAACTKTLETIKVLLESLKGQQKSVRLLRYQEHVYSQVHKEAADTKDQLRRMEKEYKIRKEKLKRGQNSIRDSMMDLTDDEAMETSDADLLLEEATADRLNAAEERSVKGRRV